MKEKVLVENTEADYYSISIKSPFINLNNADPSANTLSVIELYDFDRDKKFNSNKAMLGRFNHKEGISWDFKAILTPDKGEFVNWFSDKAFLDYSLLDPVNSRRKFSYLAK